MVIYKKILGITQEHIESHIGLGEVYTAMGEADGDGDIYEQAVSHFNEAINLSQSQRGSKRLKKKELAAVFYSRGYARVQLYEASKTTRDESLLNKALQDFKDCSKNDTRHYKAKRALEKIKKKSRDFQPQRLMEKLGPAAIFFFSIIVFSLAQYGFFFAQTNQPEKSANTVTSVAQTKPPEKSTNTAKLLDTTNYTLLTFGSLGFMAVALYLPQILKLKIGTVELEKSAVDQIKTSVELGIRRSEPQPSAIRSIAQLKPIQSDR